jgi:tol-pal system protein YbgF
MNRTLARIVVLACGASGLATAPALAQNREHQQMAAELRMLQEQAQQTQLGLAQMLNQLNEAFKKMESRLDAAEERQRKAAADQKVTSDALAAELRMIRQGTQDLGTRVGTLTEEVEAIRSSVATLASQGVAVDPSLAAGDGAATGAPRGIGLSPNRLFQTAMADYTSGSYSLAVTGFQEFLANWPKSEQADDAHYYMGNSYAQQKKYNEAVQAFTTVIQSYPTGDKVPEAYVDLGQVQRALGNTEAARTAWQTVLKMYPTSTSATIAKQRLDGLATVR